MKNQSPRFQRSPHIMISINNGDFFLGTLQSFEDSIESDEFSLIEDEEDLIEEIYDWAFDLGLDIEIVSFFDLDFWTEFIPLTPTLNLEGLLMDINKPNFKKLTYTEPLKELINQEITNRLR